MLCNRIGAESLAVAQNNYAVLWFKGKELNMVFGLQLSFARVGSTVNFWVMEPIYSWVNQWYTGYEGLGIVLFIGTYLLFCIVCFIIKFLNIFTATLTCLISMLCSIILGCLDKRAERMLRRNEGASGDMVHLKDVKDFGLSFWLITIICVAYYVAIFPFIGLGKLVFRSSIKNNKLQVPCFRNFFIQKFHYTPQHANSMNSIVYFISAFASPLLGFFVDRTGKNIFWIMFSIVATIGAHSLLAFTYINPAVGMASIVIKYQYMP